MFRRKNLKWTIPLLALLVACAVGGVYLTVNGSAQAQTAPAPVDVSSLIGAMQARADKLQALSGVLGTRMTVPEEGAWRGVPFLYRAPDSYVRKEGYPMVSLQETPARKENAWQIYQQGHIYLRERDRTVMARPGEAYERRSYGSDTDALLMVNLMPRLWFEPYMRDLEAGPVEELGGQSYYTILDVQAPLAGGDQLVRFPRLWPKRTPRKYFVNTHSYVCERLVWGSDGKEQPFANAVRDLVGREVEQVGGAQLPTTYTLRLYSGSGVYFAMQTKLENLEVADPGAIAEAEFDAWALSPGPRPVVLRPTAQPEQLEELIARDPMDTGLWLSLADMYEIADQILEAEAVLAKADELFGSAVSDEFRKERSRIRGNLQTKLITYQLNQAPQLERIYAERAERFRALSDEVHAAAMEAQAARWRQVKEAALARAAALNMKVK